MFLFGDIRRYGDLASKKGIAIMAAIAAGVVGASMVIWFVPQGGRPGGANLTPEITPFNVNRFSSADVLSFIYTRQQNLATEIELEYEDWKAGDLDPGNLLGDIDDARADVDEMRAVLDNANTPPEWQASYDLYGSALDSFLLYLDEIESIVDAGDRNPDEGTLLLNKQDSDDFVDRAIAAIPA